MITLIEELGGYVTEMVKIEEETPNPKVTEVREKIVAMMPRLRALESFVQGTAK